MGNESDNMKSIMSITSKSEGSTAPLSRVRWRNAPLHERCTMTDMVKIKEAFQEAYLNRMLPDHFRTVLRTLLNVEYDDEEFNILFMKVSSVLGVRFNSIMYIYTSILSSSLYILIIVLLAIS